MSHGAGHILDMINRLKQNRAIRPSNKAKFKEHNRETIYSKRRKIKFKTVPKEKLEKIKNRIRAQVKSEKKKEAIIYLACIAFVLAMLALILLLLN